MADRKNLLQEFKEFILRGNIVDLAVAVVVGVAFNAVIQALVKDIITPIVAAIFGKHDFSALQFEIHRSKFLYGDFINAVIAFLSIAAAVFFFVVKPLNILMSGRRTQTEGVSEAKMCPECLSSIPRGARRCAFCTSAVPA